MTDDFSSCIWRNLCRRAAMSLIWGMLLLLGIVSATSAIAQIAQTTTTQRALTEKPATDQAAALAEIVRKAWPGSKCSSASASLENSSDKGDGGWLVICDAESDYWVLLPAATTAALVTPCVLALNAGLNCYANLRVVATEHIKGCDTAGKSPDPIIRSCTVIIQSGRLASRPDVLAIVYETRAIAYGQYGQKDLALADFDEAVTLNPDNINHRFNRAVALERKGKFDQAVTDLDKVLVAKPDHWNASYERGYVFMQKRNYDRAIDDFDQVLRFNPGFDKAIQQRTMALQAKQGASLSKSLPPSEPDLSAKIHTTTELDRKAAYCMEASFGFLQREIKFVQLLKQNQDKLRALQQQAGLSNSKTQEGLKALDGRLAQSEANRVKWDGTLKIFRGYLQKHGLLSQKSEVSEIRGMSAKVAEDQRKVQETYQDCLRVCNGGNESCRSSCDSAAEASEASQRMKQCERVAKDIR